MVISIMLLKHLQKVNEEFVIWEVEGSDGKASFDMANNANVDLENGDVVVC